MRLVHLFRYCIILLVSGVVVSCAPERFLRDDEQILDKVVLRADDKGVPTSALGGYIRQHPN